MSQGTNEQSEQHKICMKNETTRVSPDRTHRLNQCEKDVLDSLLEITTSQHVSNKFYILMTAGRTCSLKHCQYCLTDVQCKISINASKIF